MSPGSVVAFAVVHSDPPDVLIAETEAVLTRVLALRVVAGTSARSVDDRLALQRIRRALLEERWVDALAEWIEATGTAVDVYEDAELWSEARFDSEVAPVEIKLAPIFSGE